MSFPWWCFIYYGPCIFCKLVIKIREGIRFDFGFFGGFLFVFLVRIPSRFAYFHRRERVQSFFFDVSGHRDLYLHPLFHRHWKVIFLQKWLTLSLYLPVYKMMH